MTMNYLKLARGQGTPPGAEERAAGLRFWRGLRDLLMRMAIVGEAGVDTASFLRQFRRSNLKDDVELERQATSCTKVVEIDNKMVRIRAFEETASTHHGMIYELVRNSCGVVIMFDVTKRKTFRMLDFYYYMLLPRLGYSHAPVVFIGCLGKNAEQRMVTFREANDMATYFGCKYYEVETITPNFTARIFSRMAQEIAECLRDGRMVVRADRDGLVPNSIITVWTEEDEAIHNHTEVGIDGLPRSGSRPVPFTGRIRRRHAAERSLPLVDDVEQWIMNEVQRPRTLEDDMIFQFDE